jgi:hypothetical protein
VSNIEGTSCCGSLKKGEAVVKTREFDVPWIVRLRRRQERGEKREREFVAAEEKAEAENGSSVVQRFKRAIERQNPAGAAAMANLEDVSNEDLFAEFLRRMKCASKGEKRIILIGKKVLTTVLFFLSKKLSYASPVCMSLNCLDSSRETV